jgi:hypothetical protein
MLLLVYVSSAVKPFGTEELTELLVKAREKNSRLGVTGMLLYQDGNFMQALEGEEPAVRQLYATISQDVRHRGTIVLLEEQISKRQFGDWSMGFRNLTDKEVHALPGFSPFMNRSLTADYYRHDPTGCLSLLALFRDSH